VIVSWRATPRRCARFCWQIARACDSSRGAACSSRIQRNAVWVHAGAVQDRRKRPDEAGAKVGRRRLADVPRRALPPLSTGWGEADPGGELPPFLNSRALLRCDDGQRVVGPMRGSHQTLCRLAQFGLGFDLPVVAAMRSSSERSSSSRSPIARRARSGRFSDA